MPDNGPKFISRALSSNLAWIARTAVRCATGVRPFSDEFLDGLVIQGEVRHQPLEQRILVLERAQPPSLAHLEAGALGCPPSRTSAR